MASRVSVRAHSRPAGARAHRNCRREQNRAGCIDPGERLVRLHDRPMGVSRQWSEARAGPERDRSCVWLVNDRRGPPADGGPLSLAAGVGCGWPPAAGGTAQ